MECSFDTESFSAAMTAGIWRPVFPARNRRFLIVLSAVVSASPYEIWVNPIRGAGVGVRGGILLGSQAVQYQGHFGYDRFPEIIDLEWWGMSTVNATIFLMDTFRTK